MDENSKLPRRLESQPINVKDVSDIEYWAKELAVSKERLTKVVRTVGTSIAAVRRHLKLNPVDKIK